MKRYLLPLIGAVCIAVTGCTMNKQVPRTHIEGVIAGKPFRFDTPKDSEMEGFKIKASTNGTVTVKVKSLKTRMNPDNITATGTAQAQIVTATGDLVLKSIQFGKEMVKEGAAAMAK